MEVKNTILFVCTGNSCRSQMAEGFMKELLNTNHIILSAGLKPSTVNTVAIKAMNEKNIDIYLVLFFALYFLPLGTGYIRQGLAISFFVYRTAGAYLFEEAYAQTLLVMKSIVVRIVGVLVITRHLGNMRVPE